MRAGGDIGTEATEPPLGWFLRVLWRNWWIVLLATLVAVGAAAAYTYTRDSEYRAEMAIVVGQDDGLLQPGALGQSPEPFTQTISGLLTSDIVARRVIEELDLSLSAMSLLKRVEVTSRPQSTVLDVSYDSTDRSRAVAVLEAVARIFPEVLETTFPAPPAASEASQITVTVFDPPRLRAERVAPRPVRNLTIAGGLGLLIGIALALARAALTARPEPRRR